MPRALLSVALLGCSAAIPDGARATSAACAHVYDIDVPATTQFPSSVAFDVGRTSLRAQDRIVITEVRGTRSDLAVGGMYLVRGEYTLSSASEAVINFSVTATSPGDGCTQGNPRAHQNVKRGSGTFELANVISYPGHPHVSFYVDGHGSGGVYFGKGDTLLR